MGKQAEAVVFGVGELFLEDPFPTRVVNFAFPPMAAVGYLATDACPPAGTSLQQRALAGKLALWAFEPAGCT
jgi:hypothetical protein